MKMSDDLISRKAILKFLYEIKDDSCIPKNYGTLLDIIRNVRNIPTAFDKGRVIEELKEYGCIIDDESGNRAVEIIEKGGIE